MSKPTEPQPGLGRVYLPDDRDARFPMAAAIPRGVELPRFRYWSSFWPPLDQGNSSQCVAYSTAGLLMASPVRRSRAAFTPDVLTACYRWAQRNDEWPGEEPVYYGTSVRAGFKAWRDAGMISTFYHAQTPADLERWTLLVHPWVAGVNWYSSFYEPNARTGVVTITPNARIVGGHAFLVYGYHRGRGLYRAINSWGEDWGQLGRFWLEGELVERLIFTEYGDAVGAVEVTP